LASGTIPAIFNVWKGQEQPLERAKKESDNQHIFLSKVVAVGDNFGLQDMEVPSIQQCIAFVKELAQEVDRASDSGTVLEGQLDHFHFER
jgi:hypothetical protein